MEIYVPVIAWGYVGIIFSALAFTLGIWAFVHGLKYERSDNVVLGVIVIAMGFIFIIASMWHFGLL